MSGEPARSGYNRPVPAPSERMLALKRLFTTLMLAIALTCVQLTASAPAWALYQLQYGDSVSITVKDNPQYSISGPVRPDGAITVPYLGELEVAGLTPSQVEARIAQLVGRFVRNPQVTVAVGAFRNRVVTVYGEVGRTGNIELPPSGTTPTLLDAIAQAGGFTDRANRTEVTVIRGNGPNAQRTVVNVEHMLKTGDLTHNMDMQDHDRIFVYEVWYPNFREWASGITLTASVFTAIGVIVTLYNRASE